MHLFLPALIVLVSLLTVPARAGQPVELELMLAVDASSSVDDGEFELQMRGLAEAFREPRASSIDHLVLVDRVLSGRGPTLGFLLLVEYLRHALPIPPHLRAPFVPKSMYRCHDAPRVHSVCSGRCIETGCQLRRLRSDCFHIAHNCTQSRYTLS